MQAFNDKKPLVGVRVELDDEETVLVGCVDAVHTTDAEMSVFVEGRVLPTRVATANVKRVSYVALPTAPESVYGVEYHKTGGVSSSDTENDDYHLRYSVAAEGKGPTTLLVINPPEETLERFLEAYVDVERGGEAREKDGNVFVPIVTSGELVPHTILAASVRFGLECVDLSAKRPTILCDTLDRARHTYAQQTKTRPMHLVGAKRELHKYCMEHVPTEWLHGQFPPFTWEAYARHVFRTTPRSRLMDLPEPLRTVVFREAIRMSDEEDAACAQGATTLALRQQATHRRVRALAEELALMTSVEQCWRRSVLRDGARWCLERELLASELAAATETLDAARDDLVADERRCEQYAWQCKEAALSRSEVAQKQTPGVVSMRCRPLNEPQQAQCLHLFLCLKYGVDLFSDDTVTVGRVALFQYHLRAGAAPRLVTVYEKSDRFLGYGDELRTVPDDEATLCPEVRNRLRRSEGRLVGAGGQGSKGIVYSPKRGTKVYQPVRQQLRRVNDGVQMLSKRMRTVS